MEETVTQVEIMSKQIDMSNLTDKQILVYDAILRITAQKQGKVDPCMAHIRELRRSLGFDPVECLRELYRKGILSFSLDINKNPMFKIAKPNE